MLIDGWEQQGWQCPFCKCFYSSFISTCPRCAAESMEQDYDNAYENYDPCYECRGLGNDYYFDDDGELQCSCNQCPFNPDRRNDYELDG